MSPKQAQHVSIYYGRPSFSKPATPLSVRSFLYVEARRYANDTVMSYVDQWTLFLVTLNSEEMPHVMW